MGIIDSTCEIPSFKCNFFILTIKPGLVADGLQGVLTGSVDSAVLTCLCLLRLSIFSSVCGRLNLTLLHMSMSNKGTQHP